MGLARGGGFFPNSHGTLLARAALASLVVWWSLACRAEATLAFRILAHQPVLANLLPTARLKVPCYYWKEPLASVTVSHLFQSPPVPFMSPDAQ